MPLSYHIQNGIDLNKLPNVTDRLCQTYEIAGEPLKNDSLNTSKRWDRIYVGDEFCIHGLPDLPRLEELVLLSKQTDTPVTLLTPVVSDFGIDVCKALFEHLAKNAPDTEIVVNDWGLAFFLKEAFPNFPLSLGRLLNKGFKDPRVPLDRVQANNGAVIFNSSSFDFTALRAQASALGVRRLERDLLPYAETLPGGPDDIATSIYFPYGYVTTGRICRIAALNGHEKKRFSIMSRCSQLCEKIAFEMKHPDYTFKMFQAGNTVFYLYPPSVIQSLLEKEETDDVRLVFRDINMNAEAST